MSSVVKEIQKKLPTCSFSTNSKKLENPTFSEKELKQLALIEALTENKKLKEDSTIVQDFWDFLNSVKKNLGKSS